MKQHIGACPKCYSMLQCLGPDDTIRCGKCGSAQYWTQEELDLIDERAGQWYAVISGGAAAERRAKEHAT